MSALVLAGHEDEEEDEEGGDEELPVVAEDPPKPRMDRLVLDDQGLGYIWDHFMIF